jgi:uncharacterized phage protein gp47/JayE
VTDYGITPEGFSLKTLDVIEEEIDTALRATFGAQINTSAQSVFGQFKGIFAEREALLWELLADIYNAQYPDTAEDVSLDLTVALTGHVRLAAKASRIEDVVLSGTSGTQVPAGTIFYVDGNPDAQFETEENVTIGAGGTVQVDCIALETGPLEVAPGTLTRIQTPISGLDSVTNPAAASAGRDLETDAELRIRRNENLQISEAGPVDAIRSAILSLNEDTDQVAIEHVIVFENYTLTTDSRGLPGKSFEVVVYQAEGSTDRDQEIAETIYLKAKPAGIQTYGDIAVEVTDSQGFSHTCYFTRPTQVPIYLELDLTVTDDYPSAGDDYIKEKIVAWGNALGPGADVIVYPALMAQLADIDGILDVAVRIGTAAGPTGDDNVPIDDGTSADVEMSQWDAVHITVAHV